MNDNWSHYGRTHVLLTWDSFWRLRELLATTTSALCWKKLKPEFLCWGEMWAEWPKAGEGGRDITHVRKSGLLPTPRGEGRRAMGSAERVHRVGRSRRISHQKCVGLEECMCKPRAFVRPAGSEKHRTPRVQQAVLSPPRHVVRWLPTA